MALAPLKTLVSAGQPFFCTTTSRFGVPASHCWIKVTPPLYSCSKGPWLGRPAMSTSLCFLSSARTGQARAAAAVVEAATKVRREIGDWEITRLPPEHKDRLESAGLALLYRSNRLGPVAQGARGVNPPLPFR